ncbi:hypothetical protein BHM03_00053347 [Ensete ventricosum]|nr:hypothetical protein BHM03_00053347 [Ensete ventricosum]
MGGQPRPPDGSPPAEGSEPRLDPHERHHLPPLHRPAATGPAAVVPHHGDRPGLQIGALSDGPRDGDNAEEDSGDAKDEANEGEGGGGGEAPKAGERASVEDPGGLRHRMLRLITLPQLCETKRGGETRETEILLVDGAMTSY